MTQDGLRELWEEGAEAWFEYHCWESAESSDAEAWFHSHQRVVVLEEAESDAPPDTTIAERAEYGLPRVYRVRFDDGLEYDVFEDELFNDARFFERPDPPSRD